MKKKTHEEYVEELVIKNPAVEAVGIYIGANTKILHKCLNDGCGYEWYATPHNILRNRKCPKCYGKFKRTHDEYVDAVRKINPDIEVVDIYINNSIPILHRCKKHNYEWLSAPGNILAGHGCRECQKDKLRKDRKKSHEQYVEDLKLVNRDVIVLGYYINAHTPILHKCAIDGHEWFAKPNNVLSGKGCRQCNETSGERQVRHWLEDNNIEFKFQKTFDGCKDEKLLPFDFYLPRCNTCIEYQGGQHYFSVEHFGGDEEFEYIKRHDKIKKEYCLNNGIKLLEIPYYEDVSEQLNNFLFI